jgi:hypothetical protein
MLGVADLCGERSEVDGLGQIGSSAQCEESLDLRGAAEKHESPPRPPRAEAGTHGHAHTAGVRERQLAKVQHHQLRTKLCAAQRPLEAWRGSETQLAGREASPTRTEEYDLQRRALTDVGPVLGGQHALTSEEPIPSRRGQMRSPSVVQSRPPVTSRPSHLAGMLVGGEANQ